MGFFLSNCGGEGRREEHSHIVKIKRGEMSSGREVLGV